MPLSTAGTTFPAFFVQDSREFQCQVLNRDLWSNPAVKSIIQEHFVFWQQYKESDEAERYMTFYQIDSWPYVAVIDPRSVLGS